mmetsp:Transcript_666/g.1510  ORF Transcript_666/g.1510 Transcript_666/m.1510 type:complete len:269 (+) Transcript_666:167-973(+)|eukprot:CAMPEP_0168285980 /NCGR_PEP_ID=MMETSP0142_2-20121227/532_1 /TAXON_ID=44445 /ORGANISM="Pseudo-nitzschia australis, Strain 10249 10 AB" /LENGTH=268 /DNA_ID=CAMNT_0008230293 /DNA_START=126 /DNA_END=932 /DNA_ORIENTATION=+
MATKDVNNTGVQTDEKKQHFDDIYVCDTPVPYKIRILDAMNYVSDEFNKAMFDEHIAPVFDSKDNGDKPVEYVDLCACFGNTTMACLHGMSYDDIRENWKDEESCQTINKARRTFGSSNVNVTAIDISPQAMAYGKTVGLYDESMVCDLNNIEGEQFQAAKKAMGKADIFLSTAALCYLSVESIEELVDAFASSDDNSDDAMMLVNFLNPFCLEKADATKRILLSKLDFVASRATRHRRMSQLEQDNYPGEEWALLELWVLKKKKKAN